MEKQKYIVKVSYVKYYEVFAENQVNALNNAVYAVGNKGVDTTVFNEVHAEIIEPNNVSQETSIDKNNILKEM